MTRIETSTYAFILNSEEKILLNTSDIRFSSDVENGIKNYLSALGVESSAIEGSVKRIIYRAQEILKHLRALTEEEEYRKEEGEILLVSKVRIWQIGEKEIIGTSTRSDGNFSLIRAENIINPLSKKPGFFPDIENISDDSFTILHSNKPEKIIIWPKILSSKD